MSKNIKIYMGLGGSMTPIIGSGSMVAVCTGRIYKTGDVVAYRAGSRNYIHRIVRKSGNRYFIRDDSLVCCGHWIGDYQIEGKVRGFLMRGIPGFVWSSICRMVFRYLRPIKALLG